MSVPASPIHDSTRPHLSLAIPCFNEQQVLASTVRQLVEAFHRHNVPVELIAVDNGSTDATGEVIDQLIDEGCPILKVSLAHNAGYGGGILRGLQACSAPLVGYLHADGQVAADDVVRLYELARQVEQPALVQVNRRFRLDGLNRRIITRLYNVLINTLFGGLGTSDVNASPKILRRHDLARMQLQSKDWFFDAEMVIKARWLGLRVVELNVLSQPRLGGRSHVDAAARRQFVINLIRWRLRRRPSISLGSTGETTSTAPEDEAAAVG